MKEQLVGLTMMAVLFFNSCGTNEKDRRIKTKYYISKARMVDPEVKSDTTFTFGGITYTNEYDARGKVIATSASDGSKSVTVTKGNTSTTTTTDKTGKVISIRTDFLNDKQKTDTFFVMENGNLTSARKFFYDNAGNEIENIEYEWNAQLNGIREMMTFKFKWEDGNVVSTTYTHPGSVDTIVMVNPKTLKLDTIVQKVFAEDLTNYYEYYSDKMNYTKGASNSKNLLKHSVQISSKGDTTERKNYRYTFDAKGRVISEVNETSDGMSYDSSAYTYY